MSDVGIGATMESLNRDLCPYHPNSAACKKNVTALWPDMANALFGNKDTVPSLCQQTGDCKSKGVVGRGVVSRGVVGRSEDLKYCLNMLMDVKEGLI